MAKKSICFDIDEKIRKKFQVKCLMNDLKQKEVLESMVRNFVNGDVARKKSSIVIKPIIKRNYKGVKVTKKF